MQSALGLPGGPQCSQSLCPSDPQSRVVGGWPLTRSETFVSLERENGVKKRASELKDHSVAINYNNCIRCCVISGCWRQKGPTIPVTTLWFLICVSSYSPSLLLQEKPKQRRNTKTKEIHIMATDALADLVKRGGSPENEQLQDSKGETSS